MVVDFDTGRNRGPFFCEDELIQCSNIPCDQTSSPTAAPVQMCNCFELNCGDRRFDGFYENKNHSYFLKDSTTLS